MLSCAEDYELALEKDKVQERLLLRRSNKADGSASQGTHSKSEGGSVVGVHLDQAEVPGLAFISACLAWSHAINIR